MTKAAKNVWVFNHFASTPATNTGAGERHYYLAKEFEKEGWQTSVFSASYNHLFLAPPKRSFLSHVEEFSSKVRFVWVWVTKYTPESGVGRLLNWLSYIFVLFLIPKRKFGVPDVIIVSSMSIWPILNALWYKLIHPPVKVIFEIRDVWPLTPIEIGGVSRSNPIIWMMFRLEKLAYRRSDGIVSVLPKADIRVKEVVGNKAFSFNWIPNAIKEPEAEYHSVSESGKAEKVIMYAGAVGPANSMDLLVDIAQILRGEDIRFKVLGDGPEKLNLINKVQKLGLNKVEFLGKVKKSDVQIHLREADALFIAWHNLKLYNYGVSANKYNDYMSLKKPIISVGDINADPVEIADCGIVIKERTPELCARMILGFINQDKEILERKGMNGYKYWKENKTYDVISRKYMNLVNSLVNGK